MRSDADSTRAIFAPPSLTLTTLLDGCLNMHSDFSTSDGPAAFCAGHIHSLLSSCQSAQPLMESLSDPQRSLSHNAAATSTETWPDTGQRAGTTLTRCIKWKWKCPLSELTSWHGFVLISICFGVSTCPLLLRTSWFRFYRPKLAGGTSDHVTSGAIQSFFIFFLSGQKRTTRACTGCPAGSYFKHLEHWLRPQRGWRPPQISLWSQSRPFSPTNSIMHADSGV